MATEHIVKQGEYLANIATQYGFENWQAIWDHPENAALKEKRKSPNVLLPGDQLVIPDKELKSLNVPTGQVHRFLLTRGRVLLRLALKDFDNQPLANTECELQIQGSATALKTDASGTIEVPIAPTAKEATLVFKDPLVPFDLSVPIKIGHLDPVDEVSGEKARLSNLGYITRPLEEVDDKIFAQTVQEFQCDMELPVTGTRGRRWTQHAEQRRGGGQQLRRRGFPTVLSASQGYDQTRHRAG